jgi:hypothetical protein
MSEQYTDMEKGVIREIGYFYLDKNNPDIDNEETDKNKIVANYYKMYEECYKELKMLGITQLKHYPYSPMFDDKYDIIEIHLSRPGLLIGEKGNNFSNLNNYLNDKLHIKFKIKIIENRLNDYLYPINYSEDMDEDEFLIWED